MLIGFGDGVVEIFVVKEFFGLVIGIVGDEVKWDGKIDCWK